ncbi:MAG: hypothetical protein B6I31_02890 [Desulfobacteraceae bacterium 4572_19]|nr:MAG: hypothetical protein B6I31_02890 [Desulfobacteraceae bacterium 4572_19]
MYYLRKILIVAFCGIIFFTGIFSQVYADNNIEITVVFKNDGNNFKWPTCVKMIRQIPASNIYRIWVNADNEADVLETLKSSGQIKFVEIVKSVRIKPTTREDVNVKSVKKQSITRKKVNDELYEWENIIDKEKIINISNGNKIVVAVLDTGIDLDNSSFFSQLYQNLGEIPDDGIDNDENGYIDDRSGWDFGDMDHVAMDYNEHGTMVTSIVVRTSPGCIFLPLKLIKDGGLSFGTGELVEGIYYAVSMGANVINLSLTIPDSQAVRQAIETATNSGCLVVSAAGNNGGDVEFPAIMDEVIAVGSLNDKESIAYWFSPQGPELDIVAPGVAVDVISLGGISSRATGTSFSTPMVSGAVCALISKFPTKNPAEIRNILYNGCRDLGSTGKDDIFGYGALDGSNLLISVYNNFEKIGFEKGEINKTVTLQDNYYCVLNVNQKKGDTPKQEWILIGGNLKGEDFLFFYNGSAFIDWQAGLSEPSIARIIIESEVNILNPFCPDLNLGKLGYTTTGENIWYMYIYSTSDDTAKDIMTIYEEGNIIFENIITLTIE